MKVTAIITNDGLDNFGLCGDAPEAELKRNSSLKKNILSTFIISTVFCQYNESQKALKQGWPH